MFRATVSGGPYTLVGSSTANAFSDRTAGLINGNKYYYMLRLINAGGSEICQSNEAAVTIPKGR